MGISGKMRPPVGFFWHPLGVVFLLCALSCSLWSCGSGENTSGKERQQTVLSIMPSSSHSRDPHQPITKEPDPQAVVMVPLKNSRRPIGTQIGIEGTRGGFADDLSEGSPEKPNEQGNILGRMDGQSERIVPDLIEVIPPSNPGERGVTLGEINALRGLPEPERIAPDSIEVIPPSNFGGRGVKLEEVTALRAALPDNVIPDDYREIIPPDNAYGGNGITIGEVDLSREHNADLPTSSAKDPVGK